MQEKVFRSGLLFMVILGLLMAIPSVLAWASDSDRAASVGGADPLVSVAHFAPFADTALGTSVTVRVNGGDAITDFEFGDIVSTSLPAGSYLIEILPTGSSTVAISGTVMLMDDTSYTLAAIGDGVNQPLALRALVDDTAVVPSEAKLRLAHYAPFASSGTEVDICTDSGTVVLTNFAYDDVTDPYVQLPPGDYDLLVAVAGTNCAVVALDLPSLRLEAGQIYDAFAIGGANSWPISVTSITGLTLTPAVVNVAHYAPFADTPAGTSVTVRLNGGDALSNFEFGDIAAGVELSPGDYLVEIIPTGSSTVAISGTFALEGGMQYTVAAIGDGGNQPLELLPLVDDTVANPAAAKLRVGHLAPFASSGTEVDICTDDGVVVIPNFAYKDVTDPYVELPAGDYDLQITLAGTGCAAVALDLPSVRLADGDIADVFAIGGANDWPLNISTITGLTLTPATVDVAHFAPFANTASGTSVTVRLNGGDALTNFEFGDIAAGVELPAGEYLVEILPTGSSTVAISGTATLDVAGDYVIAAIGDGVNQPLELLIIDQNMAPARQVAGGGDASVFVAHLAPFASSGTEVDICTDAGTAVVTDFAYKDMATLNLPAGDYDLLIALAGTNCETVALDLPSVRLGSDEMIDLYAIGGANEWPLNVTSITGFNLTPTQATVNVGHFAPFAAGLENTSVTVRVNGADAITDFVFGQLVTGVALDAGDYLIEIIPTGTVTPAITGTFSLMAGMDYTLSAIGDGVNQPLELDALVDDNSAPAAGNARARIVHYAPFASSGTEVDVCTEGGTAVLTNVPYKAFTDPYLELPAGLYDLKVTAAGTNCGTLLFDIPLIRLADGAVATIFAVGGANEFAPTVVTTPDLTPLRIFMPIVLKN
ncbi:MAG: DUF4397 domain-containing protein [Chloroflexi bacterium]|nr:DUF4397 domain-containing protein [Ardenticatenaceae bacterium]MBL1127426.1 DUF4397 domain-containing protein [Chloroflexota bacterium]NOG33489.1 DUF4397 domain-containing protein [Chloroflexota bacterium]GIK55819.1 MAG: hypothetical protein BroJett015_14820 [Chloroflexota bacterium]